MDIKTIAVILFGILLLVLLAIRVITSHMRHPHTLASFDDMSGEEFEDFCARLLVRAGFKEVETTPGSHDYGIDILALRDGITYGIQCKCYSDTVGIKAVQEAYAGKDYYDCMVGVVMTNQYMSGPAIDFARKLNVLLWDGDYIEEMAEKAMSPAGS